MPLRCLKVVVVMLVGGCSGKAAERGSPAVRSADASVKLETSQLGRDHAVTLAALGLPHHRITALIGAHRVRRRSTLETRVTSVPGRKAKQELTMTVDAEGRFAVNKQTDPQYGQEVIWTGHWLYPRLRHSLFVKRLPVDKHEPRKIADRMYGLLPAYIELLGRFLSVARSGEGQVGGRRVIKVRLGKASDPRGTAAERAAARRWRDSVVVRELSGTAHLCAETGVPLRVQLKGSWDFHPPTAGKTPRSGIPTQLDRQSVGRMTLDFSQQLSDVGAKLTVQAPDPEQVDTNVRRIRLELERQMLTGERPVSGRVDRPPHGDDDDAE